MIAHPMRASAALLGLAVLAACSGGPARVKSAPPPPVAVTTADTDAVFELLMQGKQDDARKQLQKLLKRDPMSATAKLLSDSIERDPKELLGPTSYAYAARAGDTIVGLSERFLGNRLKAYQLIRYNGLKAPVVLSPGQALRIPGEPPRVEPVRRPEPAPTRPAPTTPVAPRPKPAAPKPAATAPAANPGAARAARAAGLAALNGGDVNRAVGLLRRAAALDPGNPAIARDLSRAERIAATVRAHK